MAAALLAAGPPSDQEALGKFDLRAIPEASGIVKSRRYPGIFWVHNDSGKPPALFAIRRDGTIPDHPEWRSACLEEKLESAHSTRNT